MHHDADAPNADAKHGTARLPGCAGSAGRLQIDVPGQMPLCRSQDNGSLGRESIHCKVCRTQAVTQLQDLLHAVMGRSRLCTGQDAANWPSLLYTNILLHPRPTVQQAEDHRARGYDIFILQPLTALKAHIMQGQVGVVCQIIMSGSKAELLLEFWSGWIADGCVVLVAA